MSRSLRIPSAILLVTLLLAVQVLTTGAVPVGLEALAAPDAPVIDVWYGSPQAFGTPGNPQRQINIVGNVSGANNLSYSLNGGPDIELAMGGSSALASKAAAFPLKPLFAFSANPLIVLLVVLIAITI